MLCSHWGCEPSIFMVSDDKKNTNDLIFISKNFDNGAAFDCLILIDGSVIIKIVASFVTHELRLVSS